MGIISSILIILFLCCFISSLALLLTYRDKIPYVSPKITPYEPYVMYGTIGCICCLCLLILFFIIITIL